MLKSQEINSGHILLVDDTPDNLRLLSKILETHGFKVRKTISGKMALQSAQIEPPELILLDINMPDLNGYEVCQQLKSNELTANIPIIFISALDQTTDKIKAFENGGIDYITKPFQELEVLARVKNQFIIHHQQQQLLAKNQELEKEIIERQQIEARLQQLNSIFEEQVVERTFQLQRSLEFEERLKRITDKVRDRFDEEQIWQASVRELAVGLELELCCSAIGDRELKTYTITHEYTSATSTPLDKDSIIKLVRLQELHQQLLQGLNVQFCWCQPSSISQEYCRYTILACPIFDDQSFLGSLWLFKPEDKSFEQLEVRLVLQVTNQCAIAIRQARLYQAALVQLEELQRLNQLKDDFLRTISIELRSPIADIKSLSQVLAVEISNNEAQSSKVSEYLINLQQECDRQLYFIENLLDLQYLEAGICPLELTSIDLHNWIPYILEAFVAQNQEQPPTLKVQLDPELPLLTTDISCFERVLHELLQNAYRYASNGDITVAACSISEKIHLSVTYSGAEVSESELSQIFDKFYRIPNDKSSIPSNSGLELAIVRKLVEYLRGSIHVESQAGQVCFTVIFHVS
ncbi:histidine kinase [Scytonema hofmannii PCC 7110]|uniref:histidine kinase n=1 Tax=Scytonema hofmannii PCC 7110 TaxID=128403 RepID=A0A139XD58_9CYAN|nr:response regulator [Scytonema hofmannii]KYC42627.1 histidine kinase [Scytonema hofmannii PCC 7110]